MQPNPFAPPSELADVQGGRVATSGNFSGVRVYSPNQVALATFIGSPLASAWLIGANFVTFGNPSAARKAWIWGSLAVAAITGVGLLLPEGFPSSPIAIAYTLVARHLSEKLQARDIAAVLTGGGSQYSSWRAAGFGLVSLLGFLAVVTVVMLLLWGLGVVELE